MTYAFTIDLPVTMAVYRLVRLELGKEPPPGLIVELIVEADGRLRLTDVWQSRTAWERFRDATLRPALRRVLPRIGFPPEITEPPVRELHSIEVWAPHH